ncbi:hypothetical protein A3G16_03365 [Candidatus Curtissbacteria bacterium RIFCSPLOWO2_12_FULL_41_16]|nr:MAG: hypothetical protein A3E71_05110 [Candidatus Curtissbacteria bacterium RIFCSPHIGHO2_12_FULL_42_33]OGE02541.1 MAG: hypothetical protein A3G16_03365 [Candidatus Curtissbacteria bacterium RIFCSPLOWO2_12_FULL_41_16]
MELKQYLAVFKQYSFFILIFTIIGAALSLIYVSKLPSGIHLEQLFFVTSSQTSINSPNLSYPDDYFAQEKARNFTDTAVSILESQDFSQEVITFPETISAQKIAPQVIKLAVTSQTPQSARLLIQKAVVKFNQKLQDLAGSEPIQLKAIGENSNLVPNFPNKKILASAGAVAGFTFALFVTGLKTYFRL